MRKLASIFVPPSQGAWLPPLRYSLPLIVLMFGLVLLLAQTAFFLTLFDSRARQEVISRAERQGPRIARLAERFSALGLAPAIAEELASVRSEQSVSLAVICDEAGTIKSTGAKAQDQALDRERLTPEAVRMIHESAATGHSLVKTAASGTEVLGVYPFRHAGGPAASDYLVFAFDLSKPLTEAHVAAWTQAFIAAAIVMLGSLVVWVALDATVARRAERIADEARSMASGNLPGQPVGGDDELAQIDQALREAHVQIHRQAADLRAREAQIQEKNRERSRLEREIIDISEREKRRIGQDLHDDLCQRLAAVRMKVQDFEEELSDANPDLIPRADAIASDVADAIHITRSLARGLSPVDIESGGLTLALKGLARSTCDVAGIDCRFETDDSSPPLPPHTANQLYRIAQECITNAVKHARARHITLALKTGPQTLLLRVSNDGQPMDAGSASSSGMGLPIMRYRAESIGAVIEHESSPPDAVTAVRCALPLPATTSPPSPIP